MDDSFDVREIYSRPNDSVATMIRILESAFKNSSYMVFLSFKVVCEW